MGEIADMMLDGTMCQVCGCFINDGEDGDGYPVTCEGCKSQDDDRHHHRRSRGRKNKGAKK